MPKYFSSGVCLSLAAAQVLGAIYDAEAIDQDPSQMVSSIPSLRERSPEALAQFWNSFHRSQSTTTLIVSVIDPAQGGFAQSLRSTVGAYRPSEALQCGPSQPAPIPTLTETVLIPMQPQQPRPTGIPPNYYQPSVVTIYSTVYSQPTPKATGGLQSPPGRPTAQPPPPSRPTPQAQGISVTTDDSKVSCRPYPDLVTIDESRLVIFSRPTPIKVNCWTPSTITGDLGKVRGDDLWLHTNQDCWIHESNLQQNIDYSRRVPRCTSVPDHWVAELLPKLNRQDCYLNTTRNSPSMNLGSGRKVDISCTVQGEAVQGNSQWIKAKDQECYLPAAIFDSKKYRGTHGPQCPAKGVFL